MPNEIVLYFALYALKCLEETNDTYALYALLYYSWHSDDPYRAHFTDIHQMFNPNKLSNYMCYKIWNEITYAFINVNDVSADVWEWIDNFISHIIGNVITYPCWY